MVELVQVTEYDKPKNLIFAQVQIRKYGGIPIQCDEVEDGKTTGKVAIFRNVKELQLLKPDTINRNIFA